MKYFAQSMLSDNSLDALIEAYQTGGSFKAWETARAIGAEESIFGLLPSDFLYYLPLDDQAKVLDISCGLGAHSFTIAKLVGEVYACDLSLKNITFCQERMKNENFKNIRFLHSNIADLSLPPATFDVAIVSDFATLSDGKKNDLRRIYEMLKPGGTFYFGARTRRPRMVRRMLHDSGFKKIDFYIAHPNHHFPRFLIPSDELNALKFVINIISDSKGVMGKIARVLIKIPLVVRGIRFFLPYYAVFAKK